MTAQDPALPGLARIRAKFLAQLEDRQAHLQAATHAARQASGPRAAHAALDECQHILHKLSGMAGTVGFRELGTAARRVEELIRQYLDQGEGDAETLIAMLDAFTDRLARERETGRVGPV